MPMGDEWASTMDDEKVYKTKKDLVEHKLGASIHSGLLKDIEKQGVQKPVQVSHEDEEPHLYDGHHRVVSAYNVNPNMLIPVEHI